MAAWRSTVLAIFAALSAFAPADPKAEERRFGPFVVDSGASSIIRLEGPIGVRGLISFSRALRASPEAKTVSLDSPGGSLIIALSIAESILEDRLATVIPPDAECLSACALLFLAGRERSVKGRLGVHQVASTTSGDVSFAQTALSDVFELLRRAEVDPEIMQIMLATPPDRMHVFSEAEIERLAINREGGAKPWPEPRAEPAVADPPPLSVDAKTAVRLCDELAGDPQDPRRNFEFDAVGWEDLDSDRSISACRQATSAEPDNPRLAFQLARSFEKAKRIEDAFAWHRKAAEQGYAMAQLDLALFLQYGGQGISKDGEEALKWYRLAAESGLPLAQKNLGHSYRYGDLVPKDEVAARDWYRRAAQSYLAAAEQGSAVAQYELAKMYQDGQGVLKSSDEADKWFRRAASIYREAAKQGSWEAQNLLGFMYKNGQGVPQDRAEAIKWYRQAAEDGSASAQFSLGLMYRYGDTREMALAAKWYRMAAEQGHQIAQSSLAEMYEKGVGVPVDRAEYLKWYRKAAAQGDEEAQKVLERLGEL